MKKGSQQAMKPPITILRVWAVFVSRRKEETRVAGSKLRVAASKLRDSGRGRCGVNDGGR